MSGNDPTPTKCRTCDTVKPRRLLTAGLCRHCWYEQHPQAAERERVKARERYLKRKGVLQELACGPFHVDITIPELQEYIRECRGR